MTPVMLAAVVAATAAAIIATAWLLARRLPLFRPHTGRHTGGYLLAEIAKAAEAAQAEDLLTVSQRFRVQLADRCAAPWKALETRRPA